MSKEKPDLSKQLQDVQKYFIQYRVVIFLVIVALVYGYIVLRVHTLSSAKPNQSAVAAQSTTSQPHIDEVTINKIQQLQNNSVNVQSLFNQARQSPFQE